MTLFSDRDERFAENLRIINSRFLRKKKEPVRGERPVVPSGISKPAYLTVDPGYDTFGSNGDNIFWGRLVSDPDNIIRWDISEPDFVYFTAVGLYLIDWQIHIKWDTFNVGYAQWEVLSDLWGGGTTVRPWQGDFIWTVHTAEFNDSVLVMSGSHLVEVTDLANHLYILIWDLYAMEPDPHLDLDTGFVYGFGEGFTWTWLKVVRLSVYQPGEF